MTPIEKQRLRQMIEFTGVKLANPSGDEVDELANCLQVLCSQRPATEIKAAVKLLTDSCLGEVDADADRDERFGAGMAAVMIEVLNWTLNEPSNLFDELLTALKQQ